MFQQTTRRTDRRPRSLGAALCLAGSLLGFSSHSLGAEPAPRWTLDQALRTAFERSPRFQADRAARREAAGRLLSAGTYLHNPELSVELADRSGPAASSTDRGWSLSQELEIAGQRRRRRAVAEAELAAADADLARSRQLLAYRVQTAFVEAVQARELLEVAETDAALAREFRDFSRRRLERGAATQIELNLARASAGRAERAVEKMRAAYLSARARLAASAGAGPSLLPEPEGDLQLPPPGLGLEALLGDALAERGDLRAAEERKLAAEASTRLAEAEAWPNLRAGLFVAREEGDDITGATLGISLPVFNRNRGRIAESRARRDRLARHERALLLGAEEQVVVAWHRLHGARAAAEHLREEVLGTLDENVELLQRSFAAGRIGGTEVVTLRRELVAGRREYVEATTEAWLAHLEFELAAGRLGADIEDPS